MRSMRKDTCESRSFTCTSILIVRAELSSAEYAVQY